MKRRIKLTAKNITLIALAVISFVVFAVSACYLDSEPLWIPLVITMVSFAVWALFCFANQDLLED